MDAVPVWGLPPRYFEARAQEWCNTSYGLLPPWSQASASYPARRAISTVKKRSTQKPSFVAPLFRWQPHGGWAQWPKKPETERCRVCHYLS